MSLNKRPKNNLNARAQVIVSAVLRKVVISYEFVLDTTFQNDVLKKCRASRTKFKAAHNECTK